jgi:hypothetical protein
VHEWHLALIGEDLAQTDASTSSAPVTFATIENALNWLLEDPRTRDLRVTAVSRERPVRHVVGHFTLDPDLEQPPDPRDQAEERGEIVYGPPAPAPADGRA